MNVKAPLSLADVMEALSGANIPEKRRRDLASAINAASKLLHRNLSELPADIAELRGRLLPIHNVQAGISAKRLANIKADLALALRISFSSLPQPQVTVKRSKAWTSFVDSLEHSWQRHILARLADFCTSAGVEPKKVSDEVLARFRDHLSDGSLAKNPDKKSKRTIQTWNGIVQRARLPYTPLTVPTKARYRAIPLSKFPPSFQADLDAWIARQTDVDVFDEDGPKKALRPTSLLNIRATVRQFATALVSSGRSITSITSLATLVELDAFKSGLRFFLDHGGGKPPTWLWGMGGTLLAIARYHVKLPEPDIKALGAIRSRLKVETDRVTEKNNQRLGQFDDGYNVELLMLIPHRLAEAAAKRQPPSSRSALDVMVAVAIEL